MGASFKYAIAAFSAGEFQAFGARLVCLAKRCTALPTGNEGDRWRGELHVLLALKEFNDIAAMSRRHTAALGLLRQPASLYGPDSPWTLGSPSVLFMFYRESGKLRETLRLMRDCMPPYCQLTENHGAGAELLVEAQVMYNAGEFAEAEAICGQALNAAVLHNQRDNEMCACFLHTRLALLAGDADALFGRGERCGLVQDAFFSGIRIRRFSKKIFCIIKIIITM
jgi:LuxR family maltose regulon positive regulatory protein